MKYVSLFKFMDLYGRHIKQYHGVKSLSSAAAQRSFQPDGVYNPFTIQSNVDEETGQVLNMLRFTSDRISKVYGYGLLDTYIMPPILEMEWLKTELNLNDEITNVLMQLSYMFMAHILSLKSDVDNEPSDAWMQYLEEKGVIVEVEEVNDAPVILYMNPLPDITVPNIRSWITVLLYGSNFLEMLQVCFKHGDLFKELYYHMPFILTMFMADYHSNKLADWSANERLITENKIQDCINEVVKQAMRPDQVYTYGTSVDITQKDIEFLRSMFTIIYDKIHELNADMGLITFGEYSRIRGPETTRASVRLTHMNVKWNEEMERAKREKEMQDRQENQTEGNPFDDLFD